MTDVVLFDVSERIATVTLNRPEARNALSSELLRRLPEVLVGADGRDDVDVVILTGTDPAFCAGLDLKELGSTAGNLGSVGDGRRGPFPAMTKPVIGAVNGAAITGGLEVALACDFLVASDRARFGDTHSRRRRHAGVGPDRAAPPGHRPPAGPGDELLGQLPDRRRGLAVGAREPRRRPRRTCCRSPGGSPSTSSATTSEACAACGPPTPTSPAAPSTRDGPSRAGTRRRGSTRASILPRWSGAGRQSWSAVAPSLDGSAWPNRQPALTCWTSANTVRARRL